MNQTHSEVANELLLLADKKLKLLTALKESLLRFYTDMDEADSDKILSELNMQEFILGQIQTTDQKTQTIAINQSLPFNPAQASHPVELNDDMPQLYLGLASKLKEQQLLLNELAALNQETIYKTKSISDALKNKLKLTRQKKQILSNYQLLNTHHTGNFFNFKEGSKIY